MARDFAHRFYEQFFSGRKFVPGRCAGGVGKRDKIDNRSSASDLKFTPNDFVEFFERDELRNGEFAYGDDEIWSEDFELILHPA